MIKALGITLIQVLVMFFTIIIIAWATGIPYNYDSFLTGMGLFTLWKVNELDV